MSLGYKEVNACQSQDGTAESVAGEEAGSEVDGLSMLVKNVWCEAHYESVYLLSPHSRVPECP